MKTLKDLTAELIIWLDSECPAVAPPLEPYDNSDLSHNFCELLRIRLDEINRLRSHVEQEEDHIIPYIKSEHDRQLERMTKIFGHRPAVFEQGVNALLWMIEDSNKSVEQEPPKGKVLSPEDGLYPCPYSTATQCNLKDCCLECETLGMYKSGAVIPRFSDHSQFEKVSDEESKGYLCSVCHKNPVDAENGYDTCPDCVSKI